MGTETFNAPIIVSGGTKYLVGKSFGEGLYVIALNDTPDFEETEDGACWHLGCTERDDLYHFTHDVVPLGLRLLKMSSRHLEASLSADERHVYIRAHGPDGTQHSFLLLRNDFRTMIDGMLGKSRSIA